MSHAWYKGENCPTSTIVMYLLERSAFFPTVPKTGGDRAGSTFGSLTNYLLGSRSEAASVVQW